MRANEDAHIAQGWQMYGYHEGERDQPLTLMSAFNRAAK